MPLRHCIAIGTHTSQYSSVALFQLQIPLCIIILFAGRKLPVDTMENSRLGLNALLLLAAVAVITPGVVSQQKCKYQHSFLTFLIMFSQRKNPGHNILHRLSGYVVGLLKCPFIRYSENVIANIKITTCALVILFGKSHILALMGKFQNL